MDTAHYREALSRALQTVEEELKGLGIHNPENAEDWVATPVGTEVGEADENVSADHAEELEERSAVLADLEKQYNDLRHALARIADGTFGICEVGGEQIETERLDANPAARTCIKHRDETL
jgi:RNA polymerase-binding transcription factor DksA